MRAVIVSESCPRCGCALSVRRRRSDGIPFIGCTGYPTCKFTEEYDERTARLAERIERLEVEVARLRSAPRAPTGGTPTGSEAVVRDLIFKFHPDRNPNGLRADDVVAELNVLRAKVRK